MKIALILENSQASKNALIYKELSTVATAHGHEVVNYGMYSAEDKRCLTYVMNGLLASIVLCTKAVDFVVTGCGTGEGACLACNAFPGVQCGHVTSPLDAYLFTQVNGGNAIAIPYAQNFGWGASLICAISLKNSLSRPLAAVIRPSAVRPSNPTKRF